jgi:hypothetical protein
VDLEEGSDREDVLSPLALQPAPVLLFEEAEGPAGGEEAREIEP